MATKRKKTEPTQVDRDWEAFSELIRGAVKDAVTTIPLEDRAKAATEMRAALAEGKPTPFVLPPGKCIVPPAVAQEAITKGTMCEYVVDGVMSIPASVYADTCLSIEIVMAHMERMLGQMDIMKREIKAASLEGRRAVEVA